MMALPLPRVVADVGPGGGIVTSMGGINSLANNMILRQINQIKKQYAPTTAYSEAASKLAYANLMGPQFMAKLMGNDSALANMTEDQKRNALNKVYKAANGGSNGFSLGPPPPMPMPNGVGQPSTNSFSGAMANALKNAMSAFGISPSQGGGNRNAINQPPTGYDGGSDDGPGVITSGSPFVGRPGYKPPQPNQKRPPGGVTVEGEQWYDKNGNPVYDKAVQQPGEPSINLELTEGQRPKTYAENTGEYKGTIKQLEKEGEYRAAAKKQIGESQLGLSNSGAVLDRMTGIIKNPVFANMRNKIPGFQNKQLDYLKVMGTPEEKELIGDFLSTGESFIASTVQGFSGKPLVREFDLAQRQKITGHDTIESATGKLRSARALHDIAEQKNQIVSELLDEGYNEAEAVKKANKMVDVRAIEKATNESLQRKIEIKNSKTGEKKMVTIEEARKLGVPNV